MPQRVTLILLVLLAGLVTLSDQHHRHKHHHHLRHPRHRHHYHSQARHYGRDVYYSSESESSSQSYSDSRDSDDDYTPRRVSARPPPPTRTGATGNFHEETLPKRRKDNNHQNVLKVGVKKAGVKEAGVKEAGVKEAGVKKAAGVKEAGVKEAGVKEADVKEAGVKEAGVKEADVKEAGVKEADVKEAGVKDVSDDKEVSSASSAAQSGRGLRTSPNIIMKSSLPKCSVIGDYGIKGVCSSFYRCKSKEGSPAVKLCPPGQDFDHYERTCLGGSRGVCKKPCSMDGGLLKDTSSKADGSTYLKCVDGVPVPYSCPIGQIFLAPTKQCG